VYGPKPQVVHKVQRTQNSTGKRQDSDKPDARQFQKCYRCSKTNHLASVCRFKTATCNFCKRTGHLEIACMKKMNRSDAPLVTCISWHKLNAVSNDDTKLPKLEVPIYIDDKPLVMELDTATGGNFLSTEVWISIGQLTLQQSECNYQSASKHPLPVVGAFTAEAKHGDSGPLVKIPFLVSEVPELNLLGHDAIKALNISLDNHLYTSPTTEKADRTLSDVFDLMKPDLRLQQACVKLCEDYTELFKQELGCQVGRKASFLQSVICAVREDLAQAYEGGIARGVWTPVEFSDWGTPVVPIRKTP